MLDLMKKNQEMLDSKQYNINDQRQMLKISALKNPNDYDLYLIACCLCNYPIEEKDEVRQLRMKYYTITGGNIIGYDHSASDYLDIKSDIVCSNTGNVNKYNLYEFEINANSYELTNELWSYKAKNCLKYVDNKKNKDKTIVSISRDQFQNFRRMLKELVINYSDAELIGKMFYNNDSTNTLVDLNSLSLPFEPYQFQVEDATNILKKKRLLLGHDMGCGKTFISVLVGCSLFNKEDVIYRTLDNLEYNDIVITDKGSFPIGKIVEENIDCKVQVIKNGITKFVNILDRRCIEE